MRKKAVVLLSGGLDSATTLYWAYKRGFRCYSLVFDYAQRHRREIYSALKISSSIKAEVTVIKLSFPWKGSSLLDKKKKIPIKISRSIPSTYVPARNSIFLSIACGFAETINASYVFFGANVIDYSGYPDCRPDFIKKFEEAINMGMKIKEKIKIRAPLLKMPKEEIVRLSVKLGVPLEYTWSCYRGGKKPCGKCPSCRIRREAFKKAGIQDPLEK